MILDVGSKGEKSNFSVAAWIYDQQSETIMMIQVGGWCGENRAVQETVPLSAEVVTHHFLIIGVKKTLRIQSTVHKSLSDTSSILRVRTVDRI